jgi:hypothetical protein
MSFDTTSRYYFGERGPVTAPERSAVTTVLRVEGVRLTRLMKHETWGSIT